MEVTPEKRKVVVALDIEKKGCKLVHPIPSVGIVVGDRYREDVIEKNRICLDVSELMRSLKDDEEIVRCQQEFWDKYPELAATFEKEAMPYKQGLAQIAKYIDSCYERYDVRKILSDNPAFDLGHLDHHLVGTREYPIRHGPTGEYHSVEDPSEQLKGLPKQQQVQVYAALQKYWEKRTKHLPDDDAEGIYIMYMKVQEAIKQSQ